MEDINKQAKEKQSNKRDEFEEKNENELIYNKEENKPKNEKEYEKERILNNNKKEKGREEIQEGHNDYTNFPQSKNMGS